MVLLTAMRLPSDVNVRRAINIGIDREEMIQNVLNGYGTAAYSICDQMPWYNEESEVEYDQEEAKRLLDEAGWVEGDDGIREKDGVESGVYAVVQHPGILCGRLWLRIRQTSFGKSELK